MEKREKMLEIRGVCKAYGSQQVLRDVNITFPETGLFAIVGKSGSGKTTLLNIIASLDKADSGDVVLDGIKYSEQTAASLADIRKDRLSFVFQDSFLLDDLSVADNIRLVKVLSPRDMRDGNESEKIIKDLGIDGVKDKPANQLSGGERQRAAIARCLVKGCKVILADEPTGNLDRENSENIYKILKELSKDYLVIMVTHDTEGAAYADHIIDINEVNGCNYDFTDADGKEREAEAASGAVEARRGKTFEKAKFGAALCLKKKRLFIPAVLVFALLMAVVLIFSDLAFNNPHDAEFNTYISHGVQSVYYEMSVTGGEWNYGDPSEQVEAYQNKYNKLNIRQYTGSYGYLYLDEDSGEIGASIDYPFGHANVSVVTILIDDSVTYGEVVLSAALAKSMAAKDFAGSAQALTGKNITISNEYSDTSAAWKIGGVDSDAASEAEPFDIYIKMSRGTNALASDYRLYLEDDGTVSVHDGNYSTAYACYDPTAALTEGSYPAADNEIAVSTRGYADKISVGSTITFCGDKYTVTGRYTSASSSNIFYFTQSRFESVAADNARSFTRGESGIAVCLNDRSQFASLAKEIYGSAEHATPSYIAQSDYAGDVYELVSMLYMIQTLALLLGAGILVAATLIACYVYSNCFKSLRREMAVLLSQGASKKDIRDILNLPVAGAFVLSFILGLILFFIAIPLIDNYLGGMMEVTVSLISCNIWAVLVTAAVFIAAYAVSYLFSRRKTNKISIVDMLYNRK